MKRLKKSTILWIAAAAAAVLVCVLTAVFLFPPVAEGTPSDTPAPASTPTPYPGDENSRPLNDPIYDQPISSSAPKSDLEDDPRVQAALTKTIADLPADITPNSTEEQLIDYIMIRGGYNLFTGIAYPLRQDFTADTLHQLDQQHLLRCLHYYAEYYYVQGSGENEVSTLPVTREWIGITEHIVYREEDIAMLVEAVFGVSNYVAHCEWYDAANGTYTLECGGIGGIPGIVIYKDFSWEGSDKLTFTVYHEARSGTFRDESVVTMTRVGGRMVFTSATYRQL